MISILIPIYNFDIVNLVDELYSQAKDLNINFEIIVADDGSAEEFKIKNRNISKYEHVIYIELERNIGRSKIRNKLYTLSKYEYLIFMDCDAQVISKSYLKDYINNCDKTVVCGGTAYLPEAPSPDNYLRWYYGKCREQRTAEERNKESNNSFTTFNFMIRRDVFGEIQFDERLLRYGHEDTIFGYELKTKGYVIRHIDNPLVHLGLDLNKDFIFKTKQSVKNLYVISKTLDIGEDLYKDIKVLRVLRKIENLRLKIFISILYKISYKYIQNRLLKNNPKLIWMDLLKIGYLCTL